MRRFPQSPGNSLMLGVISMLTLIWTAQASAQNYPGAAGPRSYRTASYVPRHVVEQQRQEASAGLFNMEAYEPTSLMNNQDASDGGEDFSAEAADSDLMEADVYGQTTELAAPGPPMYGGGMPGGGMSGGMGPAKGFSGYPTLRLPTFDLRNLSLFAGVHGFKNRGNRGQDGSFGYSEGINWGGAVGSELAMQLGVRGVHSQFAGATGAFNEPLTPFTDESRNQLFITTGVFRRMDCGLQAGLVYDYMNDDWDYGLNLSQTRSELSYKSAAGLELGVTSTVGIDNDTNVAAQGDVWEAHDTYQFFLRTPLECGGEGRIYSGFTGEGDGLVGGDILVPLNCQFSLAADFAYLSPEESRDNLAEIWSLGLYLVWQPGGTCLQGNYTRPLFDVASNSTFRFFQMAP